MICTREHRMQEIACYVVGDDGAVWLAYAACEHGIYEVTPIYHPKYDLDDNADADEAPAVDERHL